MKKPGGAPNPKVRRTGVVLVVLAVLCGGGAVTGWDAPGTAGRIVLGVLAILLVVVGLLLVRSRVPRVDLGDLGRRIPAGDRSVARTAVPSRLRAFRLPASDRDRLGQKSRGRSGGTHWPGGVQLPVS
ncbi:MAG: hypothetical protein ABI345_04490 [Jatrophihabitans sp.]